MGTDRNFTLGYARVSSAGQNLDRQMEALADCDRIYADKVSGKDRHRPELEALLANPGPLRSGDTLKVASMDRLARNVDDLRQIVKSLTDRGVTVVFLKETQTFTPGEVNPISNLLLSLLGSIAAFERDLIRERQAEGIALAKAKGKYRGRKPALTPAKIEQARQRIDSGEHVAQVARDLGVGRSSLYRALNGEGTYAKPAA